MKEETVSPSAIAADALRRHLLHDSHQISHKKQALAVLYLANEINASIIPDETLAKFGIEKAIALAKRGDFNDISFIATENLKRPANEETNLRAGAKLFMNKAINYASSKLREADRADYFACIKKGFELLYQHDIATNWKDIIIFHLEGN